MLIFRLLVPRALDIRAPPPPFGPPPRPPWRAPHTSTPATGQAVCKLVKLRAPADTCISFPVNLSSTLRLRRGPTERHISHLFSCSSSLFPSRRTGIPPASILFSALLPGVRSASARIAHFCAITPLLVTRLPRGNSRGAHFMGGGGYESTEPHPLGMASPLCDSRVTLETYVPPGASFITEAGARPTASETHYAPLTDTCRFSSLPCSFCRRAASRSHVRTVHGPPLRNPRGSHCQSRPYRWRCAHVLSGACRNQSRHDSHTRRRNNSQGDSPREHREPQTGR